MNLEQDADAAAAGDVFDQTALQSVASLAQTFISLTDLVELKEGELKELKDRLRHVTEVSLPEAMDALGFKEFKLLDGRKVTVEQFVTASIPAARKGDALQWLRDHKHAGIIKTSVAVEFGKGQEDRAAALSEDLRTKFSGVKQDASVHHTTLKAFAKEMLEAGSPLPDDLFGVYVGRKAKVESP